MCLGWQAFMESARTVTSAWGVRSMLIAVNGSAAAARIARLRLSPLASLAGSYYLAPSET